MMYPSTPSISFIWHKRIWRFKPHISNQQLVLHDVIFVIQKQHHWICILSTNLLYNFVATSISEIMGQILILERE